MNNLLNLIFIKINIIKSKFINAIPFSAYVTKKKKF